jgi:membrane protein EpsK
MFLTILTSALLVSFSACFNSVYTAFNKMYVLYSIRIVYIVLQMIIIIGSFWIFGPSLVLIGLAYLISGMVFFILVWISSKRMCPMLRLDRSLYSKGLLGEIGRIGMWAVLSRLGLLMFIQASLILVNLFLGADDEAGFAIVATLISMTSTACFTITVVIAPFLYLNYASGNRENLIRIARITMKFVGIVVAFPIAYLCVFSPQIISVWVGDSYTHLSGIIAVMFSVQLAVCAASVLESVPVLFLKIRSVALVTLSIGALNIIVAAAVLAFTDFDTMGVAVVWTAAMIALNVVLYPLMIARMTSSGWTAFLRPMVPGYVALVICAAVGYAATQFFTLPSTWTAVLVVFFIAYVVYLTAALAVGLNRDDKDTIRSAIPKRVAKVIPGWLL